MPFPSTLTRLDIRLLHGVGLARGLVLYAHQDEAAIELFSGSNVVLGTPTARGSRWWPWARISLAGGGLRELRCGADQGAGLGEVLRVVRVVRRGEGGDAERWRVGQCRCADRVLHGGGVGELRDAGGRG